MGEGLCDRFKELYRRAPGGAAPADLVLPGQLDDAINGFERILVGDDALFHQKVQDALAQH